MKAREILVGKGFENVFVVEGGLPGLIKDRELELA